MKSMAVMKAMKMMKAMKSIADQRVSAPLAWRGVVWRGVASVPGDQGTRGPRVARAQRVVGRVPEAIVTSAVRCRKVS